jgi:hypothetical protein
MMARVLADHLYSIVLAGGLAVVAAGFGRLVLMKAGARFASRAEAVLFCFAAGWGALGLCVFLLGVLGFLYRAAVITVVVFFLLSALAGRSVQWRRQDADSHFPKMHPPWDPITVVALFALGACLVAGLLLALTPAVGKDALIYHLAVPVLFIKHHGFYFVDGNVFAHYPLGQEMIYILALMLQGEILAKVLHFLSAIALLFGMWLFCRCHLSGMSYWPVALLVFFTIPSVFSVSHVAYNDLAVSLYVFLSVYAFLKWYCAADRVALALSGVFAGLAMGTKYTALFVPFIVVLGILWRARHDGASMGTAIRSVLVYLIPTAIVGCPFYLKNWIVTGNPFYPFFYGVFGGKGLDPEWARLYDLFVQSLGAGRDWLDYLLLPWNVSFHAQMSSPKFDGMVGPVFLLTLPFVFGIRRMAAEIKILLVFSALLFLFWASSAQQIRYLIPVFPFLAIVVGYVLSYYRQRKVFFIMLAIMIIGCVAINVSYIVKELYTISPARYIIGREKKNAFLQRQIPFYEMFQTVNTQLPMDARVFLIHMKNYGYLCERDYYSDSMFETFTLQKALAKVQAAQDVGQALKEKGFTHILYDDFYVTGPISALTEEEKALFSAFRSCATETIKVGQGRYVLCRIL